MDKSNWNITGFSSGFQGVKSRSIVRKKATHVQCALIVSNEEAPLAVVSKLQSRTTLFVSHRHSFTNTDMIFCLKFRAMSILVNVKRGDANKNYQIIKTRLMYEPFFPACIFSYTGRNEVKSSYFKL